MRGYWHFYTFETPLYTDLVMILRQGEAIWSELRAKICDPRPMQVDECYRRARRYEESGFNGVCRHWICHHLRRTIHYCAWCVRGLRLRHGWTLMDSAGKRNGPIATIFWMSSYSSGFGSVVLRPSFSRKPLSLEMRGVCSGHWINRYQNSSKPIWSLVMVGCTLLINAIGFAVTNPMARRRVQTQNVHGQLCLYCVSWRHGTGKRHFQCRWVRPVL